MQIEGLDHIGVAVSDRAAAERFYGETLGLERDQWGLFRIGRTAFELHEVRPQSDGTPGREGIDHLALRVGNVEQALEELRSADLIEVVVKEDLGSPGVRHPVWLDADRTMGVRFTLGGRPDPDDRSWTGADGLVERIDHVGVASADNAFAHRVFAGILGLTIESTQTDTEVRIPAEFFVSDKYGVAFNTRPAVAVGGLKVSFFTVGDCELEVLQDYDPSTAADRASQVEGSTRRDQSAISRFVQTRGPGAHHIGLKVRDVDAMLRRLEAAGVELIDRQGRPGSRRAQIAFLHPKSTYGALFHLVQREELP